MNKFKIGNKVKYYNSHGGSLWPPNNCIGIIKKIDEDDTEVPYQVEFNIKDNPTCNFTNLKSIIENNILIWWSTEKNLSVIESEKPKKTIEQFEGNFPTLKEFLS